MEKLEHINLEHAVCAEGSAVWFKEETFYVEKTF